MNSILIGLNSEFSNETSYDVYISTCDPTSWQLVFSGLSYENFPVSIGLSDYGVSQDCYQYQVSGNTGCVCIGTGTTNPCPSPSPTPSITVTQTPSVTPTNTITPTMSITPTVTPTTTPSSSVAGVLYDLFCPSTVPGGCPFTFISPEGNECNGTVISDLTFTFCVQAGTTPTCVNGQVINLNESCASNGCNTYSG